MRYNVSVYNIPWGIIRVLCRYILLQKVIEKLLLLKRGRDPLRLGTTISTNFPGKFTLESFAWCMFGLNVIGCKPPHLIRCCGHDPVQEEGVGDVAACVGQGSILTDPTRLINAIDIRQRYPNCFLRTHPPLPPRDIPTSIFLHIFRILRVSPSGFLDRIREVSYRFETCFALGCRRRATARYIFAWNISTQDILLLPFLEWNNSPAIIVWMCKNLRNIT